MTPIWSAFAPTSARATLFLEADLEVGWALTHWLQVTGYSGVQLMANLAPDDRFESMLFYTPTVLNTRIHLGSHLAVSLPTVIEQMPRARVEPGSPTRLRQHDTLPAHRVRIPMHFLTASMKALFPSFCTSEENGSSDMSPS